MQSNTQVITGSFIISASMEVQQFNLIGLSDTTSFSYQGNAKMIDNTSAPLPSMPIPFVGQVSYNSRVAGSTPWDNVVITVSSGSVGLELIQL